MEKGSPDHCDKAQIHQIDRFIMAPACCWCLALTFVLQEFKFIIVEMAGLPSGGIMFLAHALAGTHWLLCIMFAGFGIYILFPTHPLPFLGGVLVPPTLILCDVFDRFCS